MTLSSYELEIVCMFGGNIDWKFLNFNCESGVSKEIFLLYVFNRLTREEIIQLEKISICQFCDTDDEIIPFILDCRGKLWFESNDTDNNIIRNNYLNSHFNI